MPADIPGPAHKEVKGAVTCCVAADFNVSGLMFLGLPVNSEIMGVGNAQLSPVLKPMALPLNV